MSIFIARDVGHGRRIVNLQKIGEILPFIVYKLPISFNGGIGYIIIIATVKGQ